MLTTLILQICTAASMDDCQVYASHVWTGPHQRYECLASIEPTLDALRREGLPYAAAYCEESEE